MSVAHGCIHITAAESRYHGNRKACRAPNLYSLAPCRTSGLTPRFNRKSSFLQKVWILTVYPIHGFQTFSPIPVKGCPVPCRALPRPHRSFLVRWSPTCLFSLLLPGLLISYPRNHCQDQCDEAFPLCFLTGALEFQVSPV